VRSRGQASTEYVAILLVVAALLAVAAVAMPGVGERVVAAFRTAICIAGGDVCRESDAAAAGLQPCVMRARSSREETAVEIALLRLGENGEWQLALQSDGTALVSRLDEAEAGMTGGIGFTFSPAGIDASVDGSIVGGYHGGRAWRFRDARAAAAFIAHGGGSRPPDVSWHALGGHADGFAGFDAGAELARAGLTASFASALGLRDDGPRRTLTLDLQLETPDLGVELPGFPAVPGDLRELVAEVTWEHGELRELALRTAAADGHRLDEFTGRLDLRVAANRASAARLLGAPTPARLRALWQRIIRDGVVEFGGYEVSERRRGFNIATRLGLALGATQQRIASERRLVDALAWVRGGPPQRRFDCLGV
jgi:hypothetical protein